MSSPRLVPFEHRALNGGFQRRDFDPANFTVVAGSFSQNPVFNHEWFGILGNAKASALWYSGFINITPTGVNQLRILLPFPAGYGVVGPDAFTVPIHCYDQDSVERPSFATIDFGLPTQLYVFPQSTTVWQNGKSISFMFQIIVPFDKL